VLSDPLYGLRGKRPGAGGDKARALFIEKEGIMSLYRVVCCWSVFSGSSEPDWPNMDLTDQEADTPEDAMDEAIALARRRLRGIEGPRIGTVAVVAIDGKLVDGETPGTGRVRLETFGTAPALYFRMEDENRIMDENYEHQDDKPEPGDPEYDDTAGEATA
jgi:hypothetical protein